jgi:hypothetical protein
MQADGQNSQARPAACSVATALFKKTSHLFETQMSSTAHKSLPPNSARSLRHSEPIYELCDMNFRVSPEVLQRKSLAPIATVFDPLTNQTSAYNFNTS